MTEIEIIKLVGHVDFDMIRNIYFHVNVVGETGRKMRDASLFDEQDDDDGDAPEASIDTV